MLFGDLFFGLRQAGVPVSLSEWMALMELLSREGVQPNLADFYAAARAVLVKDESRFDLYDQVFSAVFGSGELPTAAAEQLLEWLANAKPPPELTPEELAAIESMSLDELRELFEKRLAEQKERHDGGNRWIGTGGTSPFGHSGANPAGVRVGGQGSSRSAVQIATARRFRDYRSDRVLDTRTIGVALRRLRRLSRTEGRPELDIDETIDETCRNADELTLVFRPPRKNQARVLLLMDTGGSMDPWVDVVERLFSAASNLNHWRKFEAFHFHNCPYEHLYETMWSANKLPTADVLRDRPPETFLIILGDASMAPGELTSRYGAIDYYHRNDTPGVVWLHRLRARFPRAVWLNPMPRKWWGSWTARIIGHLYPMYPLTLDGLDDAMDCLLRTSPPPVPDLDPTLL